jgi:hypothetical protein|tara:strand:+ start:3945 stop:4619 length:675 start_codon:yes stop_codon:yes gene_type:complete
MKYTCQFCKKDFVRETSLSVHSCEPRRRRQERSERGVELGFQAYIKFYEMTQGSAKLKTYDDFCDSPYYRAFVKFGRYCVSIRAINPARFMEWVLKQNKKIDNWCSDTVYTEYLAFYLRVENVDDALARAIEFGIDWSEKTGNPPHDCLRYGGTNAMVYAVTAGRISPWIIFNSESGQHFLSELNTEQIALVYPYIDVDHWQKRFQDYPADQEYAKDILKQAGW